QRPASATAAAAVLAPAEDIPRWVARLGHRDIPVRAWVEQRAGDTAAARTVRALLRVATSTAAGEAVARSDLEAVLFGPALKAWAAIAEDLDVDFPSSPNPGDLRGVWDEQRASSFSLTTISARLRAAGERGSEALLERAQRFAWTDELLAGRQQRLADAHRLLAAAIERSSEHPLADAIVTGALDSGIEAASLPTVEDFESLTGKGVRGRIEGRTVAIGNAALLAELGIEGEARTRSLLDAAEDRRREGQTAMFVIIDGAVACLLAVADPIKASSAEAVAALHGEGLRVVMLTGDNETTARAVAAKLGIDEVIAGVLPEQKAAEVRKLQEAGHVVAMAGDGINDAPALALASVGIAMGTGTDVAMESAGVVLIKGDLTGIVKALRMSRLTMRNIRQNLFFAFAYNSAGVPIAAGVLYPLFGVLLSPMIAAAAMSFSSVSVIGNALRLRRADI
ncbi:MAG: HAD-IC family P-type ATPase, partial [Myxococcales bacterium]|nr:HAD-IC family P-type ATPase [Myxococcales bacterium]